MLNRRQFVASSVALGLGSALGLVSGAEESKTGRPKPIVLHQTDLFHPHMDPDDHFDLAAVFQGGAFNSVKYDWYLSTPFIYDKNGPN